MRIINNECLHSGKVTVSEHEMHVLRFTRCSCGKTFKIRPNKTGEFTIPRHSEKTKHA